MMIITRQYERGFQFILFPRDDFKLHSEVPIDFLVFSETMLLSNMPQRKKNGEQPALILAHKILNL
jgi:hypothetical protein